jgi:predicted MFS family arabinose efflux permease
MVGASAVVLAFGGLGGVPGLTALVGGTLLLDVGMQCGMVANTVRIYGLGADVRSRLNTAYMTCAYLGGTAGSWLGARASGRFGWTGVCALVATLTAVAVARHLSRRNAFTGPCAPTRPAPAPASSKPAGWSPS